MEKSDEFACILNSSLSAAYLPNGTPDFELHGVMLLEIGFRADSLDDHEPDRLDERRHADKHLAPEIPDHDAAEPLQQISDEGLGLHAQHLNGNLHEFLEESVHVDVRDEKPHREDERHGPS